MYAHREGCVGLAVVSGDVNMPCALFLGRLPFLADILWMHLSTCTTLFGARDTVDDVTIGDL